MTPSAHSLTIRVLPGTLAVCRLAPQAPVPDWAQRGSLWALVRTGEELSVVCSQEHVPAEIQAQAGWRALKVAGPLDFALVGVLAGLTRPLAEAGVSVFAISTFDTDYLLVKDDRLEHAVQALLAAGFEVQS